MLPTEPNPIQASGGFITFFNFTETQLKLRTIKIQHTGQLSQEKTGDQLWNLGVVKDSHLNLQSSIKTIKKVVFYYLKNISRVTGLMFQEDQEKLILVFICSKTDTCNSVFKGLP